MDTLSLPPPLFLQAGYRHRFLRTASRAASHATFFVDTTHPLCAMDLRSPSWILLAAAGLELRLAASHHHRFQLGQLRSFFPSNNKQAVLRI